jgi:hypothetical protein
MEKPSAPSLYDLYGPTSLLNLERSIAEGKIPNAEEVAAVLDANSERQLPDWFIGLIVKGLRGELKQRRGRPKASALSEIRLALAKEKYRRCLAWLQKRQNSSGLAGWSAVRASSPPTKNMVDQTPLSSLRTRCQAASGGHRSVLECV